MHHVAYSVSDLPGNRLKCERLGLLGFVRLGVGDFVFMLDTPADLRSLELIATKVAPYVRDEGSKLLAEAV